MVLYRRNYLAGGSYFFTVNLANRQSRLLVEHIDLLREVFCQVRDRKPFEIQAIVVLPEHLHTMWKLPDEDANYPGR
jgi:putative transposase